MIKFRHIITLIVTLTTFFSLQQANAGERIRLRVMSMNIKEGAAYQPQGCSVCGTHQKVRSGRSLPSRSGLHDHPKRKERFPQ